jgi:hypothetical protein
MTLDEWKIFLRGEHPTITDTLNGVTRTLTPADPDYERYITKWAEASIAAQLADSGRTTREERGTQVREALTDLDSFADTLVDPDISLTVPQLRQMLARVCRILAVLVRYQFREP